jgi:hypothetical protein
MAQLILTDTQDCPLSIVGKDAKGAVVPLQSVTWESSDAAVLTVTVDGTDPMKANASAVTAGTALITCTADADPGDGVVNIVGTLDVVVGPGQATVVEISAGTPVAQPAGSPGTTGAVITK